MSTLKADTIQSTGGGAATLTKQNAAKAWFNLDGTDTISFRDSFNCSSATDNSTGDYTVPFSSSFDDVNHCSTGMLNASLNDNRARFPGLTGSLSASQITVECCLSTDGSLLDPESLQVASHGDLA